MNIFSYFSLDFLKFFKLNIFNLNYNPLLKEIVININNIFTVVINNFAKSNLAFKKFLSCKQEVAFMKISYINPILEFENGDIMCSLEFWKKWQNHLPGLAKISKKY
jgi:hypothetical protein